jgi:hypothetical protein
MSNAEVVDKRNIRSVDTSQGHSGYASPSPPVYLLNNSLHSISFPHTL